jgi:vanillate/3-O-methylgallate O-demethylase
MAEQRSFQDVLDGVPNVVDHLYRNPPKSALNVYTVMMPADVVRPEYTTWRDEQRSWRESVALHDQSYHMNSLHVRGPEALQVFERLGINGFAGFEPGAAKQFVACSPSGHVIGDAILYYLEPEHLLLVGNPASTDWVQFNCEQGALDATAELDPIWVLNRERRRSFYRYQVEGPNAWELLEQVHGGPLPEIKFFRSDWLTIAGRRVRAMRHSMGGVPGLELSGPWDDREAVKAELVEAGKAFGLRRIGSLAYFSTVVESAWWAVPVSAIYSGDELRPYREWLTTRSAVARMSLGGSFYSPRIEDYYATPWDLGYGHLIKNDGDFVGRAALEALADEPHRRKVTLVWNADDVLGLVQRQLEDGPLALQLDFPLAATARMHYDRVLGADGSTVGLATYPTYSVNERAMLSIGSLDEAHAEPGTEVVLLWGEEEGGAKSTPWLEPHEQVEVRATVAPAPVSQAAQQYRSTVTRA